MIDKIIAYESGEMSEDEAIEFFVELINSGMVNHLQGSYGSTAHDMIRAGVIGKELVSGKVYRIGF